MASRSRISSDRAPGRGAGAIMEFDEDEEEEDKVGTVLEEFEPNKSASAPDSKKS